LPDLLPHSGPPAWTADAAGGAAFARGVLHTPTSAAGLILAATGIGFGALAHDLGFTLGHVLVISVLVFAMPAQVLLIDQLARGAGIAGAALAVALTAIRLLPMTVSMMPLIRDPGRPRWLHVYAVHSIAVTAWLEGNRLLPALPAHLRLPYFAGLGTGFMVLISAGGALGFIMSAGLPRLASAALLLMTPIYFVCSLLLAARVRTDYLAILAGALLGPIAYWFVPGFDLLIAGTVGGTFAWLAGRRRSEGE
jgi:predicted branched-subunit amino acid permease